MSLSDLEAAARNAELAFRDHQQLVDNEADAAARTARAEVTARHAAETSRLSQEHCAAAKALRDHIDATAQHPWEGKRVRRPVYGKAWNGVSIKANGPKSYDYGVVEIRRTATEFPANSASYALPKLGAPFVRLLKKGGSPGSKFEKDLGARWGEKWELDEPALAAAARQGGDVKQAPAESPQSGGDSRNARQVPEIPPLSHKG